MSGGRGPFRPGLGGGRGDADGTPEPRARAGGPEGPEPWLPRARPPGATTVSWLIGVAAIVALTWITLNSVRTGEGGSRGLPAGERLPPFAAPLALSPLEGDANVAMRREGRDGPRPACEVRGPDVLNSCALGERGPLVLAFLATRGGRCEDQLDVIERVRRGFPAVSFAAVAIRGEREDLRALVRRRGWRFPVAHDRDGAVANLYQVAVCPTITLALPGGVVQRTLLGSLDAAALRRAVSGLMRAARGRGWRPSGRGRVAP